MLEVRRLERWRAGGGCWAWGRGRREVGVLSKEPLMLAMELLYRGDGDGYGIPLPPSAPSNITAKDGTRAGKGR